VKMTHQWAASKRHRLKWAGHKVVVVQIAAVTAGDAEIDSH